jgi:hypothetical protein
MLARGAVLLTLSSNGNRSHWSYHHTGMLPPLISFVSYSYENTRGVGVFFPFRNSLVGCRGFNPGKERLSKSFGDHCQLITDHRPLTCPKPRGRCHPCLTALAATLMALPASVANKRLTPGLSPLDATFTKNRGGAPSSPVPPTFDVNQTPRSRRNRRGPAYLLASLHRCFVTSILFP